MSRPILFLSLLLGCAFSAGIVWILVARGPQARPGAMPAAASETPATGAPARRGPATGPRSAGGAAGGMEGPSVLEELRAMRRSIDALAARPGAEAAAAPPGEDALARLTRAIEELNRTLLERDPAGKPSLQRISQRKQEIDWDAWAPVIRAYHRDESRAIRSVQLLSKEEVLARFGPPTRIWEANSWGYFRHFVRDDDPGPDSIQLTFGDDGRVVYLSIDGFTDIR